MNTNRLKISVALSAMWFAFAANAADTSTGSGWRNLLDVKLTHFDVWLSYRGDQIMGVLKDNPQGLKPVGLNPPGQNVFSARLDNGEPVLRVSGEYYGCLVTKEAFSNYHFRVQFKWGEKKWEPRLTELKDSGILYHTSGDFGVDYWKSWALSHEFQIIEHGLGEYWTEFVPPNNHALAGSDEDKPGEWNTLDLICVDDRCLHIANGKVVMALKNARYRNGERWIPMTGGKLQFQSEAAEVFFRRFQIRPVAAMPKEHAKLFD